MYENSPAREKGGGKVLASKSRRFCHLRDLERKGALRSFSLIQNIVAFEKDAHILLVTHAGKF
jgi:hypothetical protein